jgi:hypothetical protein
MFLTGNKETVCIYLTFLLSVFISQFYFTPNKISLYINYYFFVGINGSYVLSNLFIKSSMHTSFNVFVSALFFALNPIYGFFGCF